MRLLSYMQNWLMSWITNRNFWDCLFALNGNYGTSMRGRREDFLVSQPYRFLKSEKKELVLISPYCLDFNSIFFKSDKIWRLEKSRAIRSRISEYTALVLRMLITFTEGGNEFSQKQQGMLKGAGLGVVTNPDLPKLSH